MLKRFFIFLFIFLIINSLCIKASEKNSLEISNKYFSFTMPDDTKGTYSVDKSNNGIFICEKTSKQMGIGGFAFGLKIFKTPKEYADMTGNEKIGELKDSKGAIYDMVLMRPTEIQYSDEKGIKEKYERLYDFGNIVEIKGINGSKYFKNRGMKGEELYRDVLKKYKKAISDNWDSMKYEKENLGYMYSVLSKTNKNLLDEIGYIYYDINSDGIDELFIGGMNAKGLIYDVYTMVNRKPLHVLSGGDVDKYYICNDVFLCNEYSSSKNQNDTTVFVLENNSTELYPQIKFTYDVSKDKKKPYYITYGNSKNLENVSKKIFKDRKKAYSKNKFNYIPLSKFE